MQHGIGLGMSMGTNMDMEVFEEKKNYIRCKEGLLQFWVRPMSEYIKILIS
jgi:hypothetical protein